MKLVVTAALALGLGLGAGYFLAQPEAGTTRTTLSRATGQALQAVSGHVTSDLRAQLLLEDPALAARLATGGTFGGKQHAYKAMQHMYSRDEAIIADVRGKAEALALAPRTWLIRMPLVNAVLFDTDEGLVLVDTGMAPAGPALRDAIRSVSQKPLHTIIYTHFHMDHAGGTWALLEPGQPAPQIIATDALEHFFHENTRIRGNMAKYHSQPLAEWPADRDDYVWPTRTFSGELTLTIGGEQFVLRERPGETDDQLYVWVPGRQMLATADYYQGFLPNAGNGKRHLRDVDSWIAALREMSALKPQLLLPAHGEAITEPATITRNLDTLADALEYITDHVIDGLNQGLRKDQIALSLQWPERFANEPTLTIQYVSPQDIARMVIAKHTGWWDDIPSHWSPAPLASEANELVQLAGGPAAMVQRARALMASDLKLASHLADWAWFAAPNDAAVQQLVMDVYRERIIDPAANAQEILVYLDQMVAAKAAQKATAAR